MTGLRERLPDLSDVDFGIVEDQVVQWLDDIPIQTVQFEGEYIEGCMKRSLDLFKMETIVQSVGWACIAVGVVGMTYFGYQLWQDHKRNKKV